MQAAAWHRSNELNLLCDPDYEADTIWSFSLELSSRSVQTLSKYSSEDNMIFFGFLSSKQENGVLKYLNLTLCFLFLISFF